MSSDLGWQQSQDSRDSVFLHNGGRIWDADVPNAQTPIELPGWYFWDETEANYHGPFAAHEEALAALVSYCETL